MSKKDFEERISVCYPHIREIYERYRDVFDEDLIALYWYPGWSHIIEGVLRTIEESNKVDKNKTSIVHIKTQFRSLYVHYCGSGTRHDSLMKTADLACQYSCRECGNLIKLGDVYCEQCE